MIAYCLSCVLQALQEILYRQVAELKVGPNPARNEPDKLPFPKLPSTTDQQQPQLKMSVNIGSSAQFSKLLTTSTIVIADCKSIPASNHEDTCLHSSVYADWCGPCKAVAPTYESLATKYSKPNRITFTKVNVDNQQAISQQYGVRAYVS
jgi:thiol-disulfide isomerase/thioredoxin